MNELLKERIKKFAPKILYVLFYLVCLFVFGVLTFPYDKLKEKIVATFNAQQRASTAQQELQIDELSSSFITGIKAKGIHLYSAATEVGKPPSEIKIDEARARISLLGLLFGNKDVSFKILAFGGTVDGSFEDHGKERSIEVNLDSVELGQVDPITQAIGLPLEGKVSGQVKLTLPEGKASKGNGAVSLEVKDVAAGDGKAKLKGALALPRLSIGTLTFTAEAKEGILKVTKLSAGGKDVEVQGDGRVQMRELAAEASLDVNVRFKINDGYRSKSDVTKSLFGAPGSSMPALFEMDPKVKQSKRTDGFYGWHVRGQLGRPEFLPSGGGGASVPSSKGFP